MSTAYEELIAFVASSGIPRSEAEHAVRRCAMAMATNAAGGYVAGGAITYSLGMNPATAMPYLIGATVAGAGYGLAKAPQCEKVREAIRYWSTATF